jgi:formimidoylglutamate deiminase
VRHLWFEDILLPGGWASGVEVGIANGRIASVAERPMEAGAERYAVGLPGLCNVHSHAFQRGMAGLSERRGLDAAASADDFWSWRDVMYRFLDHLTPDDIEAVAAQAFIEMLESGFTRVGEFHYLHNDTDGLRYSDPAETAVRIAAAAAATGIGLTLLPVFYAHSNFGGAPPLAGQRRFLSTVDNYAALWEASRAALQGDATIGIAPHSLRAVTPDQLASLLPLCLEGPIHIHAAEQVKEVAASVAFSGARPVEWLLDNAEVDRRWCIVHATHLSNAECDAMAASGAVAGLCPVTEANLGDGIFPAARYLAAQGAIGIGTDSNILIDAPAELRAAEYAQRLQHRSRNLLAGSDRLSVGGRLFTAAQAGGAQALGAEAAISVGASADIVTLDVNHISLTGRRGDLLLDSWIFAGRAGCVQDVWRHGRKVVIGGKHRIADAAAAQFRTTLRRLISL